MLKTYTLTRLYTLVMPVVTRRGTQIVEFKGVQNMKMHGHFTTGDAELQSVLEAQPEFEQGVYRITAQLPEVNEASAKEQKASEAEVEVPAQGAQPRQSVKTQYRTKK